MGRDATEDDVVFETELNGFKRFICYETVNDQKPWLPLRPRLSLGIEHKFEPFQADDGVGVSRFGVCVMPSGRGVCGPIWLCVTPLAR
jgi:hypothetical protein